MEILRCEGIKKVYGTGNNRVAALQKVDLSVEKGEFVAIVGASGSGKSTLLHILGSVDKPTEGKVIIEGTDISALNQTRAAIFRRRKVGLVYQFYNLIPTLTIRKNILMPLLLDKRKPNQEYFEQVVSSLGIADKLESLPNQLSGGQQQRAAIARSLIYRPALLLADEPTGNLDQKNSREIIDMLKLSNRNLKQTILLITHDEKIALEADRIVTIEDGQIISDEKKGGKSVVIKNMTAIGGMWKNYSIDYIKHNRASGISIIAASFIAALFLSFLCCLFYNFWLDSIEGTKLEEGSWHGRITGEISGDELAVINNFANVEKAVVNEELSGEQGTVADVYFYNKRTVYQDMSALVNILGLTEDAANYNYQLLSLYFVRIPGDNMPRLLMPAYLAIVMIVCVSLILVIHNSFATSMNSRVHQFGIFSSIGATPGQIRTCLVQEALFLSIVPIMAGILLGIIFSFGTVWGMNAFAANFVGGRQASFSCHPVILLLVLFLSIFTVLVSAWFPARKLSRLTPLESIRGTDELQLKKKKHSPVLSALFGIEGEMAGNALKAQKKALRTTSLSLMLAFLGFMIMQCFWTLSGISTNHTYFERYQDAWDVMATVKDTHIEDFGLINELRGLPNADSSVVYQKAEAVCILPQDAQSKELLALGGLEVFLGDAAFYDKGLFQIEAPIFILDDESFGEFCGQIGIASRMDGTIVLNRLWDSVNSNFSLSGIHSLCKRRYGSSCFE